MGIDSLTGRLGWDGLLKYDLELEAVSLCLNPILLDRYTEYSVYTYIQTTMTHTCARLFILNLQVNIINDVQY